MNDQIRDAEWKRGEWEGRGRDENDHDQDEVWDADGRQGNEKGGERKSRLRWLLKVRHGKTVPSGTSENILCGFPQVSLKKFYMNIIRI